MIRERSENPTIRRSQRVLLMVHELHKLGYQRLRIAPGMSPSGCAWRCAVTHVGNILATKGAMLKHWDDASHYSSADENVYFRWEDARNDNARQLAAKFVERFPELIRKCHGPDWAYAGWYVEMLGLAERGAFPIAYSDYYGAEPGCLATVRPAPVEGFIPLLRMPPGGEAAGGVA